MIFLHTKWSDIRVLSYAGECFLVQGRKNKITRASGFRVVHFKQWYSLERVQIMHEDWLQRAKLWEVND